ncbi:hypothetical protein BH24CHL1_BH24CHL1_14680 [soil metagenome]
MLNLTTVVSQAQAGETVAFTQLVERYQQLAFGYAFAILSDFHLAQDATQQAFIAAHSGLQTLDDPEKFPNWLRSIVRHQCLRIIRKWKVQAAPLHAAADIAAPDQGPENYVETQETSETIIHAIDELPPLEREVIVLYYIKDFSQQQVATFLGLPVTTINNRLYAARQRLRKALVSSEAVDHVLGQHRLTPSFPQEVGKIVRVLGPVIEVRHDPDDTPLIFETLLVNGTLPSSRQHLQVAQHPSSDITRCIAVPPPPHVRPSRTGLKVVKVANPMRQRLELETLQSVVEVLGRPWPSTDSNILETGIKAIDLACPFPEGGRIALFGDPGVGKLVLIQELVRTITDRGGHLTIFAFIHSDDEVSFIQTLAGHGEDIFPSSSAVQVVYLALHEPQGLVAAAISRWFDATVFVTEALARRRIHPAIDVLASSSQMLEPAIVGDEHCAVAHEVRCLLTEYRASEGHYMGSPGAEWQALRTRVERIENFLSQPLFAAEQWAQQPGRFVTRASTIRSFRALLAGSHDTIPSEDLLYRGSIDDIIVSAHVPS